jgi:hypothetical protein
MTRAGVVKEPEPETADKSVAKEAKQEERPQTTRGSIMPAQTTPPPMAQPSFKIGAPAEDKPMFDTLKQAPAKIEVPAKKRTVWTLLAILGLLAAVALLLWWLLA